MASANPYLNFAGNCLEAFEFYRSVFGFEVVDAGESVDALPVARGVTSIATRAARSWNIDCAQLYPCSASVRASGLGARRGPPEQAAQLDARSVSSVSAGLAVCPGRDDLDEVSDRHVLLARHAEHAKAHSLGVESEPSAWWRRSGFGQSHRHPHHDLIVSVQVDRPERHRLGWLDAIFEIFIDAYRFDIPMAHRGDR